MTVEKSIVAKWTRAQGCRSDQEERDFAQALSRKRARPAFPDEFVALLSKLTSRIKAKHNRDSPEGRALRALREIRVQPQPSWDADSVDLFFWFIRSDDASEQEQPTDTDLGTWLDLIQPRAQFKTAVGQLAYLDDMTARDYVESDPLDLDHLSAGATEA